jgi:hypothetical protein
MELLIKNKAELANIFFLGDYEKAFDRVSQDKLQNIMKIKGFPSHIVKTRIKLKREHGKAIRKYIQITE